MKKQMALVAAVAMAGAIAFTAEAEAAPATKIAPKGIASKNWSKLRERLRHLRGRLGKWKGNFRKRAIKLRKNLRTKWGKFRSNVASRLGQFKAKVRRTSKAIRGGGRAIFDRYMKKIRTKGKVIGRKFKAQWGQFKNRFKRGAGKFWRNLRKPAKLPAPKK